MYAQWGSCGEDHHDSRDHGGTGKRWDRLPKNKTQETTKKSLTTSPRESTSGHVVPRKENAHRTQACAGLCEAALFAVASDWKQPTHPSAGAWVSTRGPCSWGSWTPVSNTQDGMLHTDNHLHGPSGYNPERRRAIGNSNLSYDILAITQENMENRGEAVQT